MQTFVSFVVHLFNICWKCELSGSLSNNLWGIWLTGCLWFLLNFGVLCEALGMMEWKIVTVYWSGLMSRKLQILFTSILVVENFHLLRYGCSNSSLVLWHQNKYLITSTSSFILHSWFCFFACALQDETCNVFFAADVHYTGSIERTQSIPASSTEQPFCPVCLGIFPNLVSKWSNLFWKWHILKFVASLFNH